MDLLDHSIDLENAWYLAVHPEMIQVSLKPRQADPSSILGQLLAIFNLVFFCDQLYILPDLIGNLKSLPDFKVELSKV